MKLVKLKTITLLPRGLKAHLLDCYGWLLCKPYDLEIIIQDSLTTLKWLKVYVRGRPTPDITQPTLVRHNLMTRKGYGPYCGALCRTMPRSKFDGAQFICPDCGWRSEFPETFIARYKAKWGLK